MKPRNKDTPKNPRCLKLLKLFGELESAEEVKVAGLGRDFCMLERLADGGPDFFFVDNKYFGVFIAFNLF